MLDTLGESFHALTVIEGQSQVQVGDEAFTLNKFETLLIPAICGAYQINPIKNHACSRQACKTCLLTPYAMSF